MRSLRAQPCRRWPTPFGCLAPAAVAVCSLVPAAWGETCTTQAHMTPQLRTELGMAVYALASAVQAGDPARVRAATVTQGAGDPGQTDYLVRSTGDQIKGETLAVTQAYLLDATSRQPGQNGEADFNCALAGTAAETDFGIAGLPPGRFAFTVVEARGDRPWTLAFLLQQENNTWKMAGFYPHARAAAGHDGLWYWSAARSDAQANKPWLAWLLYGEADQLLRPANFVSTTNLERLRTEQRGAAPQALGNGLDAQSPLSLEGPNGTVYRVTELQAEGAGNGQALNLLMRLHVDTALPGEQATERNVAAGRALVLAHPELREGFREMTVIAEGGGSPVTVQRSLQDLAAAGSR